jgi:hypothetical protein
MATKRPEYVIAHPNGEDHIREAKGGKSPVWAVWIKKDGEWHRTGFGYITDRARAEKSAKAGTYGWPYTITRVIPCQ